MAFSLYIARRYTISRSKSTAVNIITRIAALGIVASTAALFIIMSAFSGLKTFTVSFTNAADPDMTVSAKLGKSILITPEQEKQLHRMQGIAAFSKIAEERVLFYFDGREHVAYLKGTDSIFTRVSTIRKHLIQGQWISPNTSQAVVGYGTSSKLSMGLFDFNRVLEVWVPKAGKGLPDNPDDALTKATLVPVGIYAISDDVDSKYVYCGLEMAQELLEFKPNQYTGLELKLTDATQEENVRTELDKIFNNTITIKNRAQQNESLYKMLNAENLVTYLFCSLVVVLTLFCLAGALIMLILDKRENIKTLFNMGAEVKTLRNIFLLQGLFITTLGVLIGLALSILVVVLQKKFSIVMLTNSLAYPVEFSFLNILLVIATIFILGFFASWIAANRVNRKLMEH